MSHSLYWKKTIGGEGGAFVINQYKRVDVFRCQNQAHAKLGKRVSVYHVLKVKKCYPNGCVYFRWKCQKLNKGEACPRGYKHVGRLCFGCKYFYDEKVAHQLQLVLPQEQQQAFWDDLEVFEDWLAEIKGRQQTIYARVHSVKPHLKKQVLGKDARLQVEGYLLVFKESYIGRTHFEDFTYASVSKNLQKRLGFRPGDELEFVAVVNETHGRLVFRQLRQVEFGQRGRGNPPWPQNEMSLLLKTATEFRSQPEKCLYCPYGTLVDVFEESGQGKIRYRRLLCLKGVQNPTDCVVQPLEKIASEGCPDEVENVAWKDGYR